MVELRLGQANRDGASLVVTLPMAAAVILSLVAAVRALLALLAVRATVISRAVAPRFWVLRAVVSASFPVAFLPTTSICIRCIRLMPLVL